MRGVSLRIAATLGTSALSLMACDMEASPPQPLNVEAVPQPEAARQPEKWSDPACEPGREGQFTSIGNRHVRYGHICSQGVTVSFDAFPESEGQPWSLGYTIQSKRCETGFPKPGSGERSHLFNGEHLSGDFFDLSTAEQVALLKRNLRGDLAQFARLCELAVDPAPFVGDSLDEFYLQFGDGWWLSR